MSSGMELMIIQMTYEEILKAVETADKKQILMNCESFWMMFNSLDSDTELVLRKALEYASEVRTIEAKYSSS